ncbi:MAG: FHA domain-containing protein [Pirellulaceae bacterium]
MTVGISLRVLDGADRGKVFDELNAPITIGREEGNTIQLNDERVSRYHVKIQEDHSKLVLTDLESTNGTKVNGEDIQLRILRYGDMITVGRSVLLFGSREQIARRLARLRGEDVGSSDDIGSEDLKLIDRGAPFDIRNWDGSGELKSALQSFDPPELPERMSPAQAAQLAELIDYFHIRIRHLLASVDVDRKAERMSVDAEQWQNLIDIQSRLAQYLRTIGEPHEPGM